MSTRRIGKLLESTRKRRGATQEQVAEALGVSQAVLSMIEEGKRVPGESLLGKIADWLQGGATPGKAKRGPYKT